MSRPKPTTPPDWAAPVLWAAALYNFVWGGSVILFPNLWFEITGLEPPNYPQIWQCVGMIVGVYGLGYALAARDPFRHWPIVLVGLVGKILGPIGFLGSALQGTLPWSWGTMILTNDLIWWIPFTAILYLAFRFHNDTAQASPTPSFAEAIRLFASHRGPTLRDLSYERPQLVVFLRHAGCTFCREALAELKRDREAIEKSGAGLALVHMGSPMDGTLTFDRYDLGDVHHFSDPQCVLYRAFGLPRGRFSQLFGWRVMRRAWEATRAGHTLGALKGDGFRLPGAFVLDKGRIVAAHRALDAADRPDYKQMANVRSAAPTNGVPQLQTVR